VLLLVLLTSPFCCGSLLILLFEPEGLGFSLFLPAVGAAFMQQSFDLVAQACGLFSHKN
jgi:hypothetical protein